MDGLPGPGRASMAFLGTLVGAARRPAVIDLGRSRPARGLRRGRGRAPELAALMADGTMLVGSPTPWRSSAPSPDPPRARPRARGRAGRDRWSTRPGTNRGCCPAVRRADPGAGATDRRTALPTRTTSPSAASPGPSARSLRPSWSELLGRRAVGCASAPATARRAWGRRCASSDAGCRLVEIEELSLPDLRHVLGLPRRCAVAHDRGCSRRGCPRGAVP